MCVFVHTDLPDPAVNILRTASSPAVGDPFEFVCNVSVVDRLIVSPDISWTKYVSSLNNQLADDDISVDAVRNGNELSLDFTALSTSDAGRYTCEAVLTIPQLIDVTRSTTRQDNLTLQSELGDNTYNNLTHFIAFYSSCSRSDCNSLSS